MKVYITGHSLGAAEAADFAVHRISNGLRVDGVFLFGCPNPGNRAIGRLLSTVPVYSFKNRRDLITAVPIDLALLNEEYVPCAPFIELDEVAPPGDDWGIFADHHSYLYQQGVEKMTFRVGAPVVPGDAITAVQDLYNTTGTWSWTNFVDGQYWAVREFPDAKLAVARGSTTALDWVHDFEALQTDFCGVRTSIGFLAGVAPVLGKLDAALQ